MKNFAAKLGVNLATLESLARSLKIDVPRHPGETDPSYQLRLNHAVRTWTKPPEPSEPPPEPQAPEPEPEAQAQVDPEVIALAAVDAAVAKFTPGDEDTRNTLRLVAAATHFGTNGDKLAKILDLNRDKFVRPRAKRLRDAGIWEDGQIAVKTLTDTEDDDWLKLFVAALVAEDLV